MSAAVPVVEARQRAWDAAKGILDTAAEEKRDATAEENESFDRAMADIDALDQRIQKIVSAEQRDADAAEALGKRATTTDQTPEANLDAEIRALATGEQRSVTVTPPRAFATTELRDLSKLTAGAGLNTVKTSFYERLMAHMIEVSGILGAGPTLLNTTSGEQIQVPKKRVRSRSLIRRSVRCRSTRTSTR
jgi:HK97 family phage major capsid protein